jgi:hypothetical protein
VKGIGSNSTVRVDLVDRWLRVTPQVFAGLINPNDLVNSVDFGQTMVNLGHHLDNITDRP